MAAGISLFCVRYHPGYPYRSGITKELEIYQRAFAQDVVPELGIPSQAFCLDIGSNDGTLLSGFKRLGMRTLGVEPTNVRENRATRERHRDLQSFFTEALATEIAREYGNWSIEHAFT